VTQKILIVDDDADIAESVRDFLECEGYSVEVAANGRDAIALLERIDEPPSLILVDLVMPIMDGSELLAELARRPSMSSIPVVVMSAASTVAPPPGIAMIQKPFGIRALYDVVKHACAN
jgi:DNA-binding response OmpR family regulator